VSVADAVSLTVVGKVAVAENESDTLAVSTTGALNVLAATVSESVAVAVSATEDAKVKSEKMLSVAIAVSVIKTEKKLPLSDENGA
jgi:hypothetical protein